MRERGGKGEYGRHKIIYVLRTLCKSNNDPYLKFTQ